MRAVIDRNPEYGAVTLMRYDWAKHRNDHLPIVRELGVKRQSVLVMFSGGREVGRVIAKRTRREIEPLFQAGMLLRKVTQ